MASTIIVAGATGQLGGRIARALRARGAAVRAFVRPATAADRLTDLRDIGAEIAEIDAADTSGMVRACEGAACVVSALSGLRDVIVDAQSTLLDAAVSAGVPRFVPSDFSIDFTRWPRGGNRNFDLRRDFHARLEAQPIAATSIFNGAFADMLTGMAPIVVWRLRRVVYWGSADTRMDFTTMDDTAAYTAAAALDPDTPRALHIAGDRLSARGLAQVASEATGQPFKLFRAGGLGRLGALVRVAKAVAPGKGQVFPPWQGMQYLRDMFSGLGVVEPLDNDRYPTRWTTAREVIAARP